MVNYAPLTFSGPHITVKVTVENLVTNDDTEFRATKQLKTTKKSAYDIMRDLEKADSRFRYVTFACSITIVKIAEGVNRVVVVVMMTMTMAMAMAMALALAMAMAMAMVMMVMMMMRRRSRMVKMRMVVR